VVQIGDVNDLYNQSKYTRNPDLITPERETRLARDQTVEMWSAIRHRAPDAKLIQLLGNHDGRINKRIAENLPEARALVAGAIRDFYTFDGVRTQHDPTEELFLKINGEVVCFQHGHRSKLGDHARFNECPTVVGHSHTGGVVYMRNRKGVYWELNAGWLGDERAPVFQYGAQKHLKKWTLGYGLIDHRGPRFCPLPYHPRKAS
jgi:hypothetical protein